MRARLPAPAATGPGAADRSETRARRARESARGARRTRGRARSRERWRPPWTRSCVRSHDRAVRRERGEEVDVLLDAPLERVLRLVAEERTRLRDVERATLRAKVLGLRRHLDRHIGELRAEELVQIRERPPLTRSDVERLVRHRR